MAEDGLRCPGARELGSSEAFVEEEVHMSGVLEGKVVKEDKQTLGEGEIVKSGCFWGPLGGLGRKSHSWM